MKNIHLLWIVPIAIILGLVIGITAQVNIDIPDYVGIEVGYTNETRVLMEKVYLCNNLSLENFPQLEELSVSVKHIDDAIETAYS